MKLSDKQVKAVILLATGRTCRSVASELSVTPQTISEWRKQADFMAELNTLRAQALDTASAKIQDSLTRAVSVLLELAEEAENPETRRKAALDLLRLGGYEPGAQETFGWGVGPQSAEAVEKLWQKYAACEYLLLK